MNNKIKLLEKCVWTYKDIMQWDENIRSSSKAERVKMRAIKEFNGAVRFGTQYVKTNSVLALYGTTREDEIKLLKGLLEDEKELC